MATTMKQQCNKALASAEAARNECCILPGGESEMEVELWSHGYSRIVIVRALGSSSLIARAAERWGGLCAELGGSKLNGSLGGGWIGR